MNKHGAFAKLRNILAELYTEEADTRRVVYDAAMDSKNISFSTKAINNWTNILHQAQKENKIDVLKNVTIEEFKTNKDLSKYWDDYLATREKQELFCLTTNNNAYRSLVLISLMVIILISIGILFTNKFLTPAVTTNTPTVPLEILTYQCVARTPFSEFWENRLGCMIGRAENGTITVEEFENAYLIWIEADGQIYFLSKENKVWFSQKDRYQAGISPQFACKEAESIGWPTMGFGIIWCEAQQSFGLPITEEKSYIGASQLFKNGQIIDSGNKIFILFGESEGQWAIK